MIDPSEAKKIPPSVDSMSNGCSVVQDKQSNILNTEIKSCSDMIPYTRPVSDIVKQDAIEVTHKAIPCSKVAQNITDEALFDSAGMGFLVKNKSKIKGKAGMDVEVRCSFNIPDKDMSNRLNYYDVSVMNAVCSLYNAGNSHILAHDIYRVMTGSKKKPRVKDLSEIEESMMKMASVWVRIDFSRQIDGMQYSLFDDKKTIADGFIEGQLLYFEKKGLTSKNGKITLGYEVLKAPVIFDYSYAIKEIATYPIKMLSVPNLSNTKRNIALKEYVLYRVSRMKPVKSKMGRRITYESIAKHSFDGYEKANRTSIKRFRDDVSKVLDHLISEKYISGYSVYHSGCKAVGVNIDV